MFLLLDTWSKGLPFKVAMLIISVVFVYTWSYVLLISCLLVSRYSTTGSHVMIVSFCRLYMT